MSISLHHQKVKSERDFTQHFSITYELEEDCVSGYEDLVETPEASPKQRTSSRIAHHDVHCSCPVLCRFNEYGVTQNSSLLKTCLPSLPGPDTGAIPSHFAKKTNRRYL